LAGEVSRRQTQEEVYVELGKLRGPITEPDHTVPAPPSAGVVPASAASPPSAETGTRRPVPAQTYSPRIVRSATPIVPKPPPFAEQVAGLYRSGFSPDLIAARLGAALSEVELAIALAEHRGPQEKSP
jgi:hypothetical protein